MLAKPKGHSLDADATIRLYPDFVVLRGTEVVSVLDAKFKRLDHDLGGDAYQLLAYLLELGPRFEPLISALGTAADRQVRSVDKVLAVRPLRLDCPPEAVLGQIEALADECVAPDHPLDDDHRVHRPAKRPRTRAAGGPALGPRSRPLRVCLPTALMT